MLTDSAGSSDGAPAVIVLEPDGFYNITVADQAVQTEDVSQLPPPVPASDDEILGFNFVTLQALSDLAACRVRVEQVLQQNASPTPSPQACVVEITSESLNVTPRPPSRLALADTSDSFYTLGANEHGISGHFSFDELFAINRCKCSNDRHYVEQLLFEIEAFLDDKAVVDERFADLIMYRSYGDYSDSDEGSREDT